LERNPRGKTPLPSRKERENEGWGLKGSKEKMKIKIHQPPKGLTERRAIGKGESRMGEGKRNKKEVRLATKAC